MRKGLRAILLGSAIIFAAPTGPAMAGGIPVYDAANFAQNVQEVMHALTQINHQVTMIDNQIRAVQGSAFTLSPQVTTSLMQMKQTLGKATALTHDPMAVSNDFRTAFPTTFAAMPNIAAITSNLNGQIEKILQGSEDATLIQAEVVGSIPQTQANVQAALNASNAATGQTQAIQAGNQLNAVLSTQLNQLTSLMVAEQRTAALERASEQSRKKAAIEVNQRARAELGTHTGTGYTPQGW